MRATLAEYVVTNNPQGASDLLVYKYGMQRTKSMREMVSQMKHIIRTYREEALTDIGNIHPDKQIMATQDAIIVEEAPAEVSSNCGGMSGANGSSDCENCEKLKESSSNCSGDCGCGCGGRCKEGSSNASGCGCGGTTHSAIAGMNYSADGTSGAEKSDTTIDTTTPMSEESNIGKAITYGSVAIVAIIAAGIIFKKF